MTQGVQEAFPPQTEYRLPFADHLHPTHMGPQGQVGHCFLLDLEHRPLSLEEVFQASEGFDMHEVAGTRRNLIVDVLEVTATRTTLHVRPMQAMRYKEMAQELLGMVGAVGVKVFGGHLRPSRLKWIVKTVGVHSNLHAAPFGALPAC